MKNILILLFFVGSFISSFSQQPPAFLNGKVKGTVVLNSGEKLEGIFQVPGIKSNDIHFFDANREKTLILSDEISYLIAESGGAVLRYTEVGKMKKSKGKIVTKKTGKKFWLLLTVAGEKADLYVAGTGYEKTKEGGIEAVAYGNQQNTPSFNYYGQMAGRDDAPVFIDIEHSGAVINGNAFFKIYGAMFFSNDPELSKKIKNKEPGYISKDRAKIFREYNGG